jgi:hypothetical protein
MTYKLPLTTETEFGIMLPGANLSVTNGVVDATGGGGGVVTASYYGNFYSNAIQTNPVANTANRILFPLTTVNNGITSSGPDIVFEFAGIYSMTYDLEVEITSGGGNTIDAWLTLDGVNYPNSNSVSLLDGGGAIRLFKRSFLIQVAAGQIINVVWSSPALKLQLTAIGTQTGPNRPATNSANFLATLVKAIP